MGRFFIDNAPNEHEGELYFRVLIEDGDKAKVVSATEFASLLGVESVAPEYLEEGMLFEHGNAVPSGKLTAERKALLDQLLDQVRRQIPPPQPD